MLVGTDAVARGVIQVWSLPEAQAHLGEAARGLQGGGQGRCSLLSVCLYRSVCLSSVYLSIHPSIHVCIHLLSAHLYTRIQIHARTHAHLRYDENTSMHPLMKACDAQVGAVNCDDERNSNLCAKQVCV